MARYWPGHPWATPLGLGTATRPAALSALPSARAPARSARAWALWQAPRSLLHSESGPRHESHRALRAPRLGQSGTQSGAAGSCGAARQAGRCRLVGVGTPGQDVRCLPASPFLVWFCLLTIYRRGALDQSGPAAQFRWAAQMMSLS